jgi:hypothetical protein
MLSKCANPRCNNIFRYFHEGKLYAADPTVSATVERKEFLRYVKKSVSPEYAWLCSLCCIYMAIRWDEKLGLIAVGKSQINSGERIYANQQNVTRH